MPGNGVDQALSPFGLMITVERAASLTDTWSPQRVADDSDDGDSLRAVGGQTHPIAGRRCVVRALTTSPSLLRGTSRR